MLIKASLWDLNAPQSEKHIHKKNNCINSHIGSGMYTLKLPFFLLNQQIIPVYKLVLVTYLQLGSRAVQFLLFLKSNESRFVLPMGNITTCNTVRGPGRKMNLIKRVYNYTVQRLPTSTTSPTGTSAALFWPSITLVWWENHSTDSPVMIPSLHQRLCFICSCFICVFCKFTSCSCLAARFFSRLTIFTCVLPLIVNSLFHLACLFHHNCPGL